MDRVDKDKIGGRELFAIIILLIGTKLSDMTASMLAQNGKNAFWMIPLISFAVFLPFLMLLLSTLKRFKNKNLVELIYHLLGKPLGMIVGLFLFLTAFSATAIDMRNYVDEVNTIYFPKSPIIVIYFIFIAACYFGAKKGFEVIGYSSFVVLPYVKLSVLFLIILALKEAIFLRVFPIFGDGIGPLLKEGVQKASIYSELIFLTMAYPSIKSIKSYHRASYIGFVTVALELALFYFIYTTIFDYESIDKLAFPFHELTKIISIGEFFPNIETLFLGFWLFAAILRFIIYLYFSVWIFGAVFNIKEFEPLLLPFAFLILTAGLVPENAIVNVLFYRDALLNTVSAPLLALPVILWLAAKWKGRVTNT
ncbi:GerAB/ArcD/ProY family transporter [Bacillus marinisedimentorum]|uniref:GerAB/ArcD/ProY family transporter n=1 Tax=Bacillus marinisedimentorum TaxID=1821260 RepID=UPI0008722DCA|nr:endospore germination permease [Bacillus marinisedimentorum]